ncbi:MAG: hypothetical protein ACJ73S_13110 [Mycobacteriales bacterium]
MSDPIELGKDLPDPDEPDQPTPAPDGAEVVNLDAVRDATRDDTRAEQAPPEEPDGRSGVEYSATPVSVDLPVSEQRAGLLERLQGSKRHPVVPVWMRSRAEFEQAVRLVAGHYWHLWRFHAMRVPFYGLKLAWRAPVGGFRLVGRLSRWASDAEGQPVREAAVRSNNPEMYLKLARERDKRARARKTTVAVFGLVGLLFTAWVMLAAGPLTQFAVCVAGLVLFGWAASTPERPVISPAVVAPHLLRLTHDVVVRALGCLGNSLINKAIKDKGPDGIAFLAPITQDGPGWRAEIDLPHGVTVTDIQEKREELASGLRRPLSCVWPEPADEEHPGRLVLWVGREPLRKMRQPAWPLAKTLRADIFGELPFGTDQRGRPVNLTLMFDNVLIGAIPRIGKTYSARVLALGAVCDPIVQPWVFELKGTGDLACLEPLAYRYASGFWDEPIEATLHALRELFHVELPRRTQTINRLPSDLCPQRKVTPQLARRRSLGLHPILLLIDECQNLYKHPKYGAEAAALTEDLIRLGPAMGIMIVLATQRPDRFSLPKAISAMAGTRFCLRVMDQDANDMVLGTSMYKNGIRATMFTKRDRGMGYLVGEHDVPQIVRTYEIDASAAERICERARAARAAAGLLAGHAAGQTPDTTTGPDILDDLAAIWPAEQDKAWNETLLERLADLRPQLYRGWEPEQLTAALKPHGVKVAQIGRRVDGEFVNRRGPALTDIQAAITQRNEKRGSG